MGRGGEGSGLVFAPADPCLSGPGSLEVTVEDAAEWSQRCSRAVGRSRLAPQNRWQQSSESELCLSRDLPPRGRHRCSEPADSAVVFGGVSVVPAVLCYPSERFISETGNLQPMVQA